MNVEKLIFCGVILCGTVFAGENSGNNEDNLLINGGMEQMKGELPSGYAGRNIDVITENENHLILLKGDTKKQAVAMHFVNNKLLYQPAEPQELQLKFQAKGTGKLRVDFYRYMKGSDGKMKYLPTAGIGKIDVTPELNEYSIDCTINANEHVTLAFSANSEIMIDNLRLFFRK